VRVFTVGQYSRQCEPPETLCVSLREEQSSVAAMPQLEATSYVRTLDCFVASLLAMTAATRD
jgi:hypothetical protein